MPKSDDWVTAAAWGRLHGLGRQGAAVAVRRCGIPKREDGKIDSISRYKRE